MNVKTYYHQKLEPGPITHDSRGSEIEAGLRVAYNYQGLVKIGTILSWKSKWRISRFGVVDKMWWDLTFEMIVKNEEGFESKLKNPNSFVII